MKLKLLMVFISFMALGLNTNAQTKKLKFKSYESVGAALGESTTKVVLQTVNGVSFENGFVGIGVGIDDYKYQTFPLFLDARYNFGKNNSFFIYGDAGYNFPGKNKPGTEIYGYSVYNFDGGFYSDAGVGFRKSISGKTTFFVSLGHSYKNLQLHTKTDIVCFTAPCPNYYQDYKMKYGRIILKAGVELF